MDLQIILPAKPFAEAKQRLVSVLPAAARERLAAEMFHHVAATACTFAGPGSVVVVSRGAEVLDIAKELGATALLERSPSGLNNALRQAAGFVRDRGTAKLLVVASDLPLLCTADLAALVPHDCAIAPDHHGHGTNALLWPVTLDFHFGEESFDRHRETARAAGREPQVISRPGLAFDVDLPRDLFEGAGQNRL